MSLGSKVSVNLEKFVFSKIKKRYTIMRISKPNIKSDKTRKKKISKYVSFIGSTPGLSVLLSQTNLSDVPGRSSQGQLSDSHPLSNRQRSGGLTMT